MLIKAEKGRGVEAESAWLKALNSPHSKREGEGIVQVRRDKYDEKGAGQFLGFFNK